MTAWLLDSIKALPRSFWVLFRVFFAFWYLQKKSVSGGANGAFFQQVGGGGVGWFVCG